MQCEQKENKSKAVEHDQGLEEENGPPDEDINGVESSGTSIPVGKKGLSDAAIAVVVSTFFCFP